MEIKDLQNNSNLPCQHLHLHKKGPRELTSEELMHITGGGGVLKIIGKVAKIVAEVLGIAAAEKGLEELDKHRNNKS